MGKRNRRQNMIKRQIRDMRGAEGNLIVETDKKQPAHLWLERDE